MEPKNCVGGRLALERERLGLNQAECARLGGVSKNTQGNYETGQTSPSADYLLALAGHGLDMLYVLTGQRGLDIVGVLTAEEAALVDNYRSADPVHQASLRAVGASFAEQDKRKEQARKAGNQ